ncbi:hypothetical protein C2S51_032633 [Perilla frutescens var. frutescens]|nr:hypothetical protein C2S51_032633 [Perilla frutescens var. frutescens]
MSLYQQQQRLAPSFSHISTGDREELHTDCISRNSEIRSYIHNRFLMTGNNRSNFQLSRNIFQLRNLSSASGGGRVPFEIEVLNDMVGVVGDKAVEAAPMVNEVAIVAANSFPPVAALQYLVDYVHCYTGFNWWASIAVTTLLLRFIQIPLLIHRQKFILKNSKTEDRIGLVHLEEAEAIIYEHMNKFGNIFALGFLISNITMLSFFLAILNMAEKVPSFITGGTLWFTDLTTPDSMRLPVLFALTLWITLELHPRIDLVEGKNINKYLGALALLVTVTLGFPKAIYCYWITSNLFSIAFSIVLRDPLVQKLLGISTDKKTH